MFKNIEGWKQKIASFLLAQTISLFGSSLVQYAIIWYITLSTSSGKMLTISTLCGFVPQIIISLFAGVWIDRYNRKVLIMVSDAMIAVATATLIITFVMGYQEIWLLFIVLVVRSFGSGIQTPAVQSIIPQMVPDNKLMKVNGIYSTVSSFILFLSPAISGAILSVASIEIVLCIDVVTAVIGIGITLFISIPKHQITKIKKSTIQEIKEGFIYLKRDSLIKKLLGYQFIILFLISCSAFLTPLMITRVFGSEVWRLTVTEMTYSLGMVAGGLLVTNFGRFKNKLQITLLSGMLYGVLMIGLGTMPLFIGFLICNTLIGMTSPCYNGPITVSLQQRVESHMQGRIFSVMQITTTCALPLGMVLFGPLADYIPVQVLFIVSGVLVVVVSMYLFFTKQCND